MFKESIKMSWSNIIHNKMRSFLTVLGVLIGVAAIIALISIVESVTKSITDQVMSMGANKIIVQAIGTPIKRGLTQNDINEFNTLDNIRGISPTVDGSTNVAYKDKVMEGVSVQGRNEVHFGNTEDLMESGRAINILDCESKNRVCLIGKDIKAEFFPTDNPINKEIIINGVMYTIIGTLQESSGFSMNSNDNAVIIPYTTAMSLLGTGYVNSVDVYMIDGDKSDNTTKEIEQILRTAFNYNEDGYFVFNMQNILDTVSTMTGMMTGLLAGIASIALVVGGIGIMNMMLVSVTERTTEIGLRKALGAEPITIQWQFLLEALFLSIFGGILGIIVGFAVAYIACIMIDTTFAIAGYSITLAIGFSAAIGLIFGYAPARKASRLNPIDALRSV